MIERRSKSTIDTSSHLPYATIYGVDDNGKLLNLLQTISGQMYDNAIANKKAFEKKLMQEDKDLKRYFPHLKVQFYYQELFVGQGSPWNNPPFVAITTQIEQSDTLILAWRGSTTPADWVKNFRFDPKDVNTCGKIKVQGAYYDLIKKYFKCPSHFDQSGKGKDLKRLVETGSIALDQNGRNPTPIKRIILTGHSSGGGLAQVAHQILTLESSDFSVAIKQADVDVYTVAFSAPMTTAVNDSKYQVENMHNFVLSRDVIPRLYGNLAYVHNVLHAVLLKLEDKCVKSTLENFIKKCINRKANNLKDYRHVGKIVYYEDFKITPKILTSHQFSDIKYNGDDNLKTAIKIHTEIVRGPALA